MIAKILKLFKKNKVIRKEQNIYEMDSMGYGFWGNSIKFSSPPNSFSTGSILSIVGWKANRPKKGDFIRIKGTSGNISIAKITKVKLCVDPNDMFFGTIRVLGYDMDYMRHNNIETQFTRSFSGKLTPVSKL